MKAAAFHGVGDIRLEEVKEPRIKDPHDAILLLDIFPAEKIKKTGNPVQKGSRPGGTQNKSSRQKPGSG